MWEEKNLNAQAMNPPDLRRFLDSWPYDRENNIRLVRIVPGREFILVRQPMGVEQCEVEGRPDGQRPRGAESLLAFYQSRLAKDQASNLESPFQLNRSDCSELLEEGMAYCHRFVLWFGLKQWARASQDLSRNLLMLNLVEGHAESAFDRLSLSQWRSVLGWMQGIVQAMMLLEKGRPDEALQLARASSEGLEELWDHAGEFAAILRPVLQKISAVFPSLRPPGESLFLRQGDYWTIHFQGQVVRLKDARGLHYLADLLRHPGQEFHVSELLAKSYKPHALWATPPRAESAYPVAWSHAPASILDAQAKSEYRRRLEELRGELEEAERFNDPERAARIKEEMNCIAQAIAAALGLGGRQRKTGSDAERARSAVTKRVKESISRISESIPPLGRHLALCVRTGYYLCYNPRSDNPGVNFRF